jgi:hypothetical protein
MTRNKGIPFRQDVRFTMLLFVVCFVVFKGGSP